MILKLNVKTITMELISAVGVLLTGWLAVRRKRTVGIGASKKRMLILMVIVVVTVTVTCC